jgi:hypothetical protein
VKIQEQRNNGERSEATETRRAEWCMVSTLSSLLFCADVLGGIWQELCRLRASVLQQARNASRTVGYIFSAGA